MHRNLQSDSMTIKPECHGVTDAQLKNMVFSRWPSRNGKTVIPFGFSSKPYWSSLTAFFINYYPNIYPSLNPLITKRFYNEVIKALKQWENASNHTISFIEQNEASFFSQGIYFYLAGSEEAFSNINGLAYTIPLIDYQGFMRKALIMLPIEPYLSQNPFYFIQRNAILHEIGHALGFDHIHKDKNIKNTLRNSQYGMYCSVMPYIKAIASNVSVCECTPQFAINPGPLDVRMLDLAYNQNKWTFATAIDITVAYDIIWVNFLITSLYTTSKSFLSHLAFKKNWSLISEKTATLIVDVMLLTALLTLEPAMAIFILFGMSAATKFISRSILNAMHLPELMQDFLKSNYSLYLLNMTLALLTMSTVTNDFYQTANTSVISILATFTTIKMTTPLAKTSASLVNYITEVCSSRNKHGKQEEITPRNYELDILIPKEQSAIFRNGMFRPKSIATRNIDLSLPFNGSLNL